MKTIFKSSNEEIIVSATPTFCEQVSIQNGHIQWNEGSYFRIHETYITVKCASLDKFGFNLLTFIPYFTERIPDLRVQIGDKKTVFFKSSNIPACRSILEQYITNLVFEKFLCARAPSPTVID